MHAHLAGGFGEDDGGVFVQPVARSGGPEPEEDAIGEDVDEHGLAVPGHDAGRRLAVEETDRGEVRGVETGLELAQAPRQVRFEVP